MPAAPAAAPAADAPPRETVESPAGGVRLPVPRMPVAGPDTAGASGTPRAGVPRRRERPGRANVDVGVSGRLVVCAAAGDGPCWDASSGTSGSPAGPRSGKRAGVAPRRRREDGGPERV